MHSHPWCVVYLDGDKLGTTPLNGIEVPAGRHRLGCVNDGKGIKLSKRISLEVGGRASETFRFGRGKIQVRVKPWGAVWIDGDKKGITPLGAVSLFEGMHRVRVVNEDLGKSRTLHVRVEAGRTKTVRVNLTD